MRAKVFENSRYETVEKPAVARRAAEQREKMDEAIAAMDEDAFKAAYEDSFRYIKASERATYMVRFLTEVMKATCATEKGER